MRYGLGVKLAVPLLVTLALGFGVLLYVRATRARTRANAIGLGLLVALLLAINASAYFGPPPPDVRPMAGLNLALVLVIWILQRIDRAREPRAAGAF